MSQFDGPYDHYGNQETMEMALILENHYEINSRLSELAIEKNYELSIKDMHALVYNSGIRIRELEISHIPQARVNWQLLADDFNTSARELPREYKCIPTSSNAPAPKPDEEQFAGEMKQLVPLLQMLEFDASDTQVRLNQQVKPKEYALVKRVLEAMGGSWNRSRQAHVFEESPRAAIEQTISSGRFVKKYNFGYFPTQRPLVETILGMLDIREGMVMLEPEIGQGHIADVVREHYPDLEIDGFEINPKNHALVSDRFPVILGDFLEQEPAPVYDIVFMNPPFEKMQDIDHVMHAMKFLKPGGQLAAIMSGGVLNNSYAKAEAFREKIAELGGRIVKNPSGAFKESGTSVETITVHIPNFPGLELKPQRRMSMSM